MQTEILKISEIFYSFQGESTFMGRPTLFIRLHGCNLNCRICDTKYSLSKKYKVVKINEVVKISKSFKSPYVCITGGEPLLQLKALRLLIQKLLKQKKVISIETNGSLSIRDISKKTKRVLDVKTPSTGYCPSFNIQNLKYLTPYDELKFVISNKADFEFAQKFITQKKLDKINCTILMSPNLAKKELANKLITWIIDSKQGYVFQPQLHKLIKEKPKYLIKRV